tara:strand:+ start:278 stop:1141 length:864 start_codon:yes stop_codon:yes gene_type:complete
MRVLITGGSGFIGCHLVDKLISNGYKVRILDIKTPHLEKLDYINGSILDLDTVEKATSKVDVIFHFAGFSNIDKVVDDPLGTIKLNILGTANLLEHARLQGINRFILASSVYVYDKGGHLYKYSKQVSENLCIQYEKLFDLSYTILRFATAYGPRSRGEDVISIFARESIEKGHISVKGDGKQTRNFIYVDDLAEGCVRALSEKCRNKILTIAGEKQINIRDLSLLIKDLFNGKVSINIETENDRESDYSGEIENVDESFEILDWKPAVNLEAGIKKYIEWSKAHFP